MSRLITLLFGAAAGAAAAHLFDRESGARRRDQLREQARAGREKAAPTAKSATEKARGAVSTATTKLPTDKAKGAFAGATSKLPGRDRIEDVDDVTLARKVETEIFRDADAPKGQVSVDVQNGVVNLRGEVADESWISKLADEAGKVDGIKGVNNLLHRPGVPAPTPEPQGGVTESES
jgi:osmotically-inducible protein OsmY